jgi:UDP-N-acetylglucosamine--N-acetylmuramyl-(pentapeptide) pyrophosphoryl-undecaprenol N-acetylglucosamine transferase
MSARPSGERHDGLRCLIAAGGTAGHVLPSLAVAEALRGRGVAVTFAGSPDRVEASLVPAAGYELDAFEISGFPRTPSAALLRALVRAGRAPRACAAILRRRRPHVVLGGGGYVAGPMVYAAWRRRIPAALTEADARLGLANRLAAPFARRIFLAYEIPGRGGAKYRVTGRPVPRRAEAIARDEARRRFGLPPGGLVLLVAGGSQGARFLNDYALSSFGTGTFPVDVSVLHLTGARDYDALTERPRHERYRLLPFTDDFGAALAAADLALARAGGTVWELAAAGVPAVLVPYPHATGDHQRLNAEHFERGGGAVLVSQDEEPELDLALQTLLRDPTLLRRMSEAMLAMARPEAADEIAEELIALATA